MTRNSLFKFFSIAVVLVLLVAACGDDDDADPTSTSPAAGGAPTETRETENGGDDNGEDLAARGEQLYTEQGCQACHSTDGSANIGPTWQGLWMSEVTLDDGSTVTADEDYISESIRDPNAKVHEGFQSGLMPPFPDMPDEDIEAFIAFIQTLD